MQTPMVSFRDYLGAIRRRKWMVTWIILASIVVGAVVCVVLPKSYRSSTLIMIENQRVPEGYVKGVITNSPQDRLATIQQLVLSRSLLGRVIEEFKLYSPEQDMGDVLESIRRRVTITTTREHAFMLSFSYADPSIAQRVTARLAELFIEQHVKTREQLVGEASEFLAGELNTAQKELEAKEKAISEFKLNHMGELPGQIEANLRALDRLQADMTATSETISRLNDRLSLADKAINEYESGELQASPAPTGPAPGNQPAPLMKASDLRKARIKELERNLVNLSASYKDTYPDIIHLKQEIAKFKALPMDEDEPRIAREEMGGNGKPAEKLAEKKLVDAYHRDLLKQRADIRSELQSLKERQARIAREVHQYEARVERTPMREQQLASLTRDYENMQRNYQALLERRLNARMAENLEKRQKGEQFRIIDPAHFPTFPESPDVTKVMLMALVAGCGLGFGTAVTFESMRSGFRHGDEVERLLGIPILAEVPSFETVYGRSFPGLTFQGKASESRPPGRESLAVLGRESGNGFERGKKAPLVMDRVSGSPGFNFIMKWRPKSVVAEQYRIAATRMALLSNSRKSTVVVMTSSLPGEGKTSTALNVAYALSYDLGKKTLLVDCDFKQAKLHSYAGVRPDPGLSRVLQDDGASIESCIQQFDGSSLWIIPSGSDATRLIELFKLKKLTGILEQLREEYEYIILDAPPVLPLADMNVFAGMGDILALVIRSGNTPTHVVQKAIKSLQPLGPTGIILTGVQANESPYYFSGYYGTTNNPKS